MKTILLLMLVLAGFYYSVAQTSQYPGEVFIQQSSFDHNDTIKQFTGDLTTMFEMDFDAFSGFEEESNSAVVNMYGNDNQSSVVQSGWGNMALVNILGD